MIVGKSVKPPAVVMRPILLMLVSANQRLPSAPTAMNCGFPAAGNSVTVPAVVIRPILPTLNSVNQRFPSGPAVIPTGSVPAVVIGNSVMIWAVDVPARPIPTSDEPEREAGAETHVETS